MVRDHIADRVAFAASTYLALVGLGWIALTFLFEGRVAGTPHDGQAFMSLGIFGFLSFVIGILMAAVIAIGLRGRGIALPVQVAAVGAAGALAFALTEPFATAPFGDRFSVSSAGPLTFPVGTLVLIAVVVATLAILLRQRARRSG